MPNCQIWMLHTFKSQPLTRLTFVTYQCHVYLHLVLWQLTLTHVGSICVILCSFCGVTSGWGNRGTACSRQEGGDKVRGGQSEAPKGSERGLFGQSVSSWLRPWAPSTLRTLYTQTQWAYVDVLICIIPRLSEERLREIYHLWGGFNLLLLLYILNSTINVK